MENETYEKTQDAYSSEVLEDLENSPDTVCVNCPHAIWHITEKKDLRVFCLVMHALIDENLKACDGKGR